jgi:ketol-acid reductoisomerase
LESTQTPATVLLKAVEKVLELNGVQQQVGKVSDRKELAEFLGGANLTQINITVNEEYQEALEDVIDGQLVSERIQSAE